MAEGCAEPIKVGLITDETGALAIYGAHILRAFPLGMEYATGAAGEDKGDYTSYMLDGCEIQVYVRDDQSNPETTATVGRELIEEVGVHVIVGTVSSGATATLQELARENDIIHIAAPAAANDLTGSTSMRTPSAPAATTTRTRSISANTWRRTTTSLCRSRLTIPSGTAARLPSAMPAPSLVANSWPKTSLRRPIRLISRPTWTRYWKRVTMAPRR